MKDKRVPGQSQLDYLWTTYGYYKVSDELEKESIPTTELLQKLTSNISNQSVSNIKVIGDKLIGFSVSGEELFYTDISEFTGNGKSISYFGKRYISQQDIDNGCLYALDSPVYFLRFSDGSELLAPIDQYQGQETSNIVVTINNNLISANLKINNSDTIIPIINTDRGIQADIKLANNIESIQLTKDLEGLKARIILNNEGKSLNFKYITLETYKAIENPDLTTVYFIENKNYFYFGKYKIGSGDSLILDDYYTKDELNNIMATKEYVRDQLTNIEINWKTLQ